MKLKISETKENGIELYIVRDENNDRVYVMRERYLFFKKEIQLYDAHKKYIAESLMPFNAKKCTFKEHNKVIEEMHLISNKIKNKYELDKSKWQLEIDITFTEYKIYDDKQELIAEVRYDLPERAWFVDIKKSKDISLTMLILLSVISISRG